MNNRTIALLAVAILMFGGLETSEARERNQWDKALRQLGRGIGNVATGFFEIPDNIYQVQREEGEVAAITYGLLRGVWRCTARSTVGVFEIATSPFVRFEPIIEPEWTSEGGPISAIHPREKRYPRGTVVDWQINPLRVDRNRRVPKPHPADQ